MSTSSTSVDLQATQAVDSPNTSEDHRVRTGALRRERTRRKLLAAAMGVFAEKGVDAPVIEDFIAAAGVARGTFYNYFSTTQDLLDAVTSDLSDEILASIDKVVLRIEDPLQRMTCGCLLYMHLAVDLPNWGAFVMHTGLRGNAIGKLVDVYLPRDLELAREAGQVDYVTVRSARDLILGCVTAGIQAAHTGEVPGGHMREMFALALRGIGVSQRQARDLSMMELPEVTLPTVFEDGV
jgi:AcrR family transcriptional regulator